MLTSKQRSYLRSLANNITPIFQIGKGGLEENVLKQIDVALEARELIKLKILNNCDIEMREASDVICEALSCEGVQIIGKKLVLYRKSVEKPRIELL